MRPVKSAMEQLTLKYVWKQKGIPTVLRRTGRGEKLRVRLPLADDNGQWLQNGRRTAPRWIGGDHAYWELPKSWFDNFVDRALQRYGKSTSFSLIASKRSARGRARKHRDTNANVLAWEPGMAGATTEAGSRSLTPSRLAGASAISPVVCSRLDK